METGVYKEEEESHGEVQHQQVGSSSSTLQRLETLWSIAPDHKKSLKNTVQTKQKLQRQEVVYLSEKKTTCNLKENC